MYSNKNNCLPNSNIDQGAYVDVDIDDDDDQWNLFKFIKCT